MSCNKRNTSFVGAALALATLGTATAEAKPQPSEATEPSLQQRLARLSQGLLELRAALSDPDPAKRDEAARQIALWGDFSDGIFGGDFGDGGLLGGGAFSDGVLRGDFGDGGILGGGAFSDGVFTGDFSDIGLGGFSDFTDSPLWGDWWDW